MSARKHILLKRHRRQKRIALLLALVVLALVGVLVAWWWVPILLVLGWVAHEAWFADHLFYSPGDDYSYAFAESTRAVNGRIDAGCVRLEGELEAADALILQVLIKASWLGRWFDPYVLIGNDRQDFERGVDGRRYLNLSGQGELLAQGKLSLRGRFCRLDPLVTLHAQRNRTTPSSV